MAKQTGKYRSQFEAQMGEVLEPAGAEYEPFNIRYTQSYNYTPDFVFAVEPTLEVLVEAKGWFRPGDRAKYKAIRDALPSHQELVFLLMHPAKKVSKGATLTMSGWCTKEGIEWFMSAEGVIKYVNAL